MVNFKDYKNINLLENFNLEVFQLHGLLYGIFRDSFLRKSEFGQNRYC